MKIPRDAFEFYVRLGEERSYEAVARHYNATKRAVVLRAKGERWQVKLAERERQVQEATSKKAVESDAATRERQLRMVRTIQGKALEALRSMPLNTAMEAVRALDMGIRQERGILGDPTAVTSDAMESLIRAEYARWMRSPLDPECPVKEECQ